MIQRNPSILKLFGVWAIGLRCKDKIKSLEHRINTKENRFCYVVIYDKILPQILPQAEIHEVKENAMEELIFNLDESEVPKKKKMEQEKEEL